MIDIDLGQDFLYQPDILSQSVSATIDVGNIENKKAYQHYLEFHGFDVTKEANNIWTVKATESS